jgi:hypothetical protein
VSIHLKLGPEAQARLRANLERGMTLEDAISLEARRMKSRRVFKGIMTRSDARRFAKTARRPE